MKMTRNLSNFNILATFWIKKLLLLYLINQIVVVNGNKLCRKCWCTNNAEIHCQNVPLPWIAQASSQETKSLIVMNTYAQSNYYSGIDTLPKYSFQNFTNLQMLQIISDSMQVINSKAFYRLSQLQEIALIDCIYLTHFPRLSRLLNAKKVIIRHSNISRIPENAFHGLNQLQIIDLSDNKIVSIQEHVFANAGSHLGISIDLSRNPLNSLHSNAFEHFYPATPAMLKLNISGTYITHLNFPSDVNRADNGLISLRSLDADSRSFIRLPKPLKVPLIRNIQVHHPYLCCIFQSELTKLRLQYNQSINGTETRSYREYIGLENMSNTFNDAITYSWPWSDNPWKPNGNKTNTDPPGFFFPSILPPTSKTDLVNQGGGGFVGNKTTLNKDVINLIQYNQNLSLINYTDLMNLGGGYGGQSPVICRPQPNEFTPCENILGDWYLRIPEWFMFIAATIGNILVLIVIYGSPLKFTITKFLICNLAIADLCMGFYLGTMATIDAIFADNYANFAIAWQLSAGCKLAGFIAVFSTELSVYTLLMITIERYMVVTNAMYYKRHLKLRGACIAMLIGWIFGLTLATLPLLHVNSYSKTCICLPSDIDTLVGKLYMAVILTSNGMATILVMGCYLHIFYVVHYSNSAITRNTANRTDLIIARRMLILIFVDFLCWAPIAVFGLSAVFGLKLISVSKAKFLMVFIFPLNSCMNPFLYTFFSKSFHKDCKAYWNCVHSKLRRDS